MNFPTLERIKIQMGDQAPILAVVAASADQAVQVSNLDSGLLAPLYDLSDAHERLCQTLYVKVAKEGLPGGTDIPAIAGSYEVYEHSLRFIPHFPFLDGVPYYVVFDPRELDRATSIPVLTLAFEQKVQDGCKPTVVDIYPTSGFVPENLLRLYVLFSSPMQRGSARAEISLLNSEGEEVSDALYSAPVELWDREMRCLTLLLDPGRIKRGVGPHRTLGPPLRAGSDYVLRIGQGMRDADGRTLNTTHYKRFSVREAAREAIKPKTWTAELPTIASCDPLRLTFPRPLDWAMLQYSIRVFLNGVVLKGAIQLDAHETRWSFIPVEPWMPGQYQIEVASELEDPCGNDVQAAFDRHFNQRANVNNELSFSLN